MRPLRPLSPHEKLFGPTWGHVYPMACARQFGGDWPLVKTTVPSSVQMHLVNWAGTSWYGIHCRPLKVILRTPILSARILSIKKDLRCSVDVYGVLALQIHTSGPRCLETPI